MSRLNVGTTRKRMGEGAHRSAPRGVLLTWLLADDVKESLLEDHFEGKDIELINRKATH